MSTNQLVRHVSLRHLVRLTGDFGIYEHAHGPQPRREHGYCTDDNARLLIVATRNSTPSFTATKLEILALDFLSKAVTSSGKVHNRMNLIGQWVDEPTTADCWGRLVWAMGVCVAESKNDANRRRALACFESAIQQRSEWLRANSFAALGASEILRVFPRHQSAWSFLRTYADQFPKLNWGSDWLWPEDRLTYANAAIPDALIATGDALGDRRVLDDGLALLDWLLFQETRGDRLSVTPTSGRGPGDHSPIFDQQPIEPATLAEACARAYTLTHDPVWNRGLKHSIVWFLGHNDGGQIMIDPISGGGFDGLTRNGVNRNQGAESTLAMISTLQHLAERKHGATD